MNKMWEVDIGTDRIRENRHHFAMEDVSLLAQKYQKMYCIY